MLVSLTAAAGAQLAAAPAVKVTDRGTGLYELGFTCTQVPIAAPHITAFQAWCSHRCMTGSEDGACVLLQAGNFMLQARLKDGSAEAVTCSVACAPGPLSLQHCRSDTAGLAQWRASEEGSLLIHRLDKCGHHRLFSDEKHTIASTQRVCMSAWFPRKLVLQGVASFACSHAAHAVITLALDCVLQARQCGAGRGGSAGAGREPDGAGRGRRAAAGARGGRRPRGGLSRARGRRLRALRVRPGVPGAPVRQPLHGALLGPLKLPVLQKSDPCIFRCSLRAS